MNILIYGAGVLGSFYAARLQNSGQNVTLLARGERLRQLREHGIVLEEDGTGRQMTTAVNVTDTLLPDDAYDWIFVIMRKNQVASVLPTLAANHATPNILFMTNTTEGADAVASVGRERVALGFVGVGGARVGHIVRVSKLDGQSISTTLGEPNGQMSQRLLRLAQVLEGARFSVTIERHMDAWLKTHVALVSPIANAIYMADGDIHRLAHQPESLRLMIQAVREGFRVLHRLGVPTVPLLLRALVEWVPVPLLLRLLMSRFDTQAAELNLARHANAATDEMRALADEFYVLVQKSGLDTPAIDRLRRYMPEVPEAVHA